MMAIALLGVPATAQASFHFIKVREVYVGDVAHPDSEYVVLQMYAAGQNFVQNHKLTEYDCTTSCTAVDTTFAASVPNGQNQRTILLASSEAVTQFSITADAVLPSGSLELANGAVCWATEQPTPLDCVSWGNYAGTNAALAGTPVDQPTDGKALQRTIAPNCATMLEAADDTNDSATDFAEASPTPRNNASPITETLCPPHNTTAPSISGTPLAGQTLSCAKGTWTGSPPISYAYSWLHDGVAVTGETASTYVVRSADRGHAIKCRVTASNAGGQSTATSTAVVIKSPPRNTSPPEITGTPKVGKTLSCSRGTWTGSLPITYTRQWLRDGAPIAGATGASYVAKPADAGKFIRCRVTAHNAAGQSSKTSAAVKVT